MEKIFFTTVLFFALFSVPSCKKYGDGYVKGTVLETGSKTPLKNVKVVLNETTNDLSGKEIKTTYTDDQGKFTIQYKKERKTSYFLIFSEKDHYQTVIPEIEHSDNKKNNSTIYLNQYAFLKLRVIKNSTSANRIYVTVGPSMTGFPTVSFAAKNTYDTLLHEPFRITGNNNESISWIIMDSENSNSSVTSYGEKIQVRPGDTLTYTIEFD